MSNIHDIDKFVGKIKKATQEIHNIFLKGKYYAIIIGYTRRNKMYQTMTYEITEQFLQVGFQLNKDIVKRQFNCRVTGF